MGNSRSSGKAQSQRSEQPQEPPDEDTAKPSRLPFDLEALEGEIEELRGAPPFYVSRIGALAVPTFVCESKGDLRKPSGCGPWDFTISVSGCLDAEQTAALQAAKDSAAAHRCKARGAAQALLRAEQELVNLTAQEGKAREAQEGCLTARTFFQNLPSVGTWLLPPPPSGSSEAAAKDPGSGRAKADLEALEALADEVQACARKVSDLKAQESSALEEVRKANAAARELPDTEAYAFPFRVGIRFTEAWPWGPPSLVRFQCVFHHALTDEDDSMLEPFYKTLPKQGGRHSVRGVVEALHEFLVDPIKKWGSPSIADQRRSLESAMQDHRRSNESRLRTIRKYGEQVRHPELFESPPRWREEWFAPAFWRASQEGTPEAWRAILTEHLPGEVFSFEVFTEAFCQTFVEEIFSFYASGLPARRPNSMNNYGIILNEIGLEPMIDELQRMLQPLGDMLWPGPGSMWDGHHCFIVRYREGEDLGLDMHTDDSDVTFNICLGLDFEAAGLQFCGLMGAANHRKQTYTYQHRKGTVVCHLGRKRHGADDISSGERLNLILWNHSHTYRQSAEYTDPPYVKEEGPPDAVCVSYTHDRDFGKFKEYPDGKEKFKGRGWCPPRPYEYSGFKPDSDKVVVGG